MFLSIAALVEIAAILLIIGIAAGMKIEELHWHAKAGEPRTAMQSSGEFFYVIPAAEYIDLKITLENSEEHF